MRSIDARETLRLEREPDPSRQAGKGMLIVLIDRRPLTTPMPHVAGCRVGPPDLRRSSRWAVPADLLDAAPARPARPHIIIFSIGDGYGRGIPMCSA